MFRSKLPDVGTTIFTVMSRRARELGALNLGQGFPDYPIDPRLTELVTEAMAQGLNQYAPMEGVIDLRQRIAQKLLASYELSVDPETEITVTLGATEAIYAAIQAVIGPGDEAIVFDPAYDSYEPAVRLAGGRCIRLPLLPPGFRYDWDAVKAAINPRTRLILFNSPHNPACTAASAEDLNALAEVIRGHDIYVMSDEVYEHVTYDGRAHASVLKQPELAEKAFVVFSFGKTMHATGMRVGYCIAPPELTRELRKVHQFNTFSIAHATAGGDRALSGREAASLALAARLFSGQARSGARCPGEVRDSRCRRPRAPISSCWTSAPSRRRMMLPSPSVCSPRRVWRRFPCRRSTRCLRPCPCCACALPSRTARWMRLRQRLNEFAARL